MFEEPKSGEHYLGKVRLIEDTVVRVSIFAPDEYVFDMGRRNFPGKLDVGDVFKYFRNGQVKLIPPKKLSALEIQALKAQVDRDLPMTEF